MRHGIGDTKDVLSVCEAVQLACAELYHYFAELFKADRESFLLWLKAAMEEENHARLFALLGKLSPEGVTESAEARLAAAETTLCHVRSLHEKVRQSPPAMAEALQIAIELEMKLDSFLTENVMKFADRSCEKSFLSLTSAGGKLRESLQEAFDRWSAA